MKLFRRFSRATASALGHPIAFAGACALVVGWAALGPRFGWSDTHQLVINTATTILTFLAVFLLQHTQDADTRAIHAKLDEVLRALPQADESLRGIERKVDDGNGGH